MTAHPFRLVNPPPGQADIIEAAIAAIDYPWERLADAVADDYDKAVVVEWDDTGGQVSGQFWAGSLKIKMGSRAYQLAGDVAFVFAHEVGHLVDAATLTDADRAALTALFHDGPPVQIGHFNHDHPDAGHVSEGWADNANAYVSRLNESFADLFVATFAPSLWDGHYPRFVHWTDDLAAVRRIALGDAVVTASTPEPDRHKHRGLWRRIRNLRVVVKRLKRRVRRLERRRR